jgi:hypothetical protein
LDIGDPALAFVIEDRVGVADRGPGFSLRVAIAWRALGLLATVIEKRAPARCAAAMTLPV